MRVTKRRVAVVGFAALVALNISLWLAQGVLALPGSLASYFFGPKFVRGEIILQDSAGAHDYLIDRGHIRSLGPSSLVLRERDGTVVTVPVSATATITFKGAPTSFSALKRGMVVTTVREGQSAPAETVQATPR
ncbi:MAG TPA: hypothetical protein VGF23_11130 [Gaiellaceae bacterium]|jgi:hypothetical protein